MKDAYLWTITIIMFGVLIGFCMPAIEYMFGDWAWLILLLLAGIGAAIAFAITGAHREE